MPSTDKNTQKQFSFLVSVNCPTARFCTDEQHYRYNNKRILCPASHIKYYICLAHNSHESIKVWKLESYVRWTFSMQTQLFSEIVFVWLQRCTLHTPNRTILYGTTFTEPKECVCTYIGILNKCSIRIVCKCLHDWISLYVFIAAEFSKQKYLYDAMNKKSKDGFNTTKNLIYFCRIHRYVHLI